MLKRAALLLSALFGDKALDGGTVAGLACINLVPIGWGEGAGGYAGCFGDVLDDGADVARRVVIWAARFTTRLKNVGDEWGKVAAKTRLRGGARFARHCENGVGEVHGSTGSKQAYWLNRGG